MKTFGKDGYSNSHLSLSSTDSTVFFLLQFVHDNTNSSINPLKTKRRLLYLKTQFVPRSKHFSSRL